MQKGCRLSLSIIIAFTIITIIIAYRVFFIPHGIEINHSKFPVFGIDVSTEMVSLANDTKSAHAILRNDANILAAADNFTNGYGFDSVIITAAGQHGTRE